MDNFHHSGRSKDLLRGVLLFFLLYDALDGLDGLAHEILVACNDSELTEKFLVEFHACHNRNI